jgi:outer membrane protein OmpA-like peptidoglycan-associated protein
MIAICYSPTQRMMKKKLTLILFLLTLAFNLKVSATSGQMDPKNSNYVVIGAFSVPKNALEFTEDAKRNNFSAQYSINPLKRLFYVYILRTRDHEEALNEVRKLRQRSPYYDAWVFCGLLGDDKELDEPIAGEKGVKIEAIETPTTVAVPPPASPSAVEEVEPGTKKFFFKIFTDNDKVLQGDVDVMDLDKTKPRKMASYRGNVSVNVKPVNKSGNISLVCEVFGYRKILTVINFNEPQATEGITVEDNKAIVPFELVRLKKGDIVVMYNVFFYKDAGIMLPESKYEVNSLLEMLNENKKVKIRIHGHTNGNARGKVISMGESKSFFALTTDVKEGFGSAKELSEERAMVIQSYLVNQGIDPSRMEVKGWGGKKPIYEEDHVMARANVRVEIEILED